MFGLSLHTWEGLMLGSLGFAALAAGAVVLATYAVVHLQRKEMTESKAEFDQYRIDAGAKVAELQATAEAARAEIAASKAETAKANERTAALELARAKIEARLAPRSLTQAQQNELSVKLAEFKDVRGTIVASSSTPESEMFVSVLLAALHGAHWDITMTRGTATPMFLFPTGVIVQYPWELGKSVVLKDGQLTVPSGPWTALVEALNAWGISATALPAPLTAPSNIAIVVSSEK